MSPETWSQSKGRHASFIVNMIYEKYNRVSCMPEHSDIIFILFSEALSGLFQSRGKWIISKEKTVKALWSVVRWIHLFLWGNMNGSGDVISEPCSASCDCALSRGTRSLRLRVGANCEGERQRVKHKGKWERRGKCVGVYWAAASKAPSSTIT